jgi:hypothetical protein
LAYYWRNCKRWYRRDRLNRAIIWVLALAVVLMVLWIAWPAEAQELRRPMGRLLPPDFERPPEGVEWFEAPVPKALSNPYPECRTGWGMSWRDPSGPEPRRRQTWIAWPCGSFWAFRYQEWLQSEDGLHWYHVKLREFWWDTPVEYVDRYSSIIEWLLERYPPGSPPAELP